MLAHTCTSAALYMSGHPMSKNGLAYFFLEKKKFADAPEHFRACPQWAAALAPTQTWRPMQPWEEMGQGRALAPVSPTVS